MTPVFCCGFECGVSSASAHWLLGASASFSTSTIRNGARSLRANPTAATTGIATSLTFIAASAISVIRGYVYFSTLPNVDVAIISDPNSGAGAWFKNSDSKIYSGSNGAFGITGVLVTTGVWYRIDIKTNLTTNPWTIDVSVNGVACSQKTVATAGTTTNKIQLGSATSNTSDIFFDDVLVSQTTGDFPIGSGYIVHFVPTADGTHNIAGAGDFQRTLTGTDILNATTTAFQLVDDVPLESGASVDWVNLVAPPNATDYVECIFGPAPGTPIPTFAPRAVEVIAGIHQAGTGTGNMEIRINDNGTTNVLYTATTVAGVTSVAYKRKHYATAIAGGGAWTLASGNGNFNNLRVRFGSPAAVDANPDQYFDCIMVEAEFAEFTSDLTSMHRVIEQPFFPRPKIFTSGQKGGIKIPFDTDAQAFIDTADISNSTERRAINQLVGALKSSSGNLWSKIDAAWIFCGSHLSRFKFNLKNPATFTLIFHGGTPASTGWTPNGTTDYAETGYNPSAQGKTDMHISVYSRTNNSTNGMVEFGGNVPGPNIGARISVLDLGNTTWALGSVLFPDTASDSKGFYCCHGINTPSNDLQMFKNGIGLGQRTLFSVSASNCEMYLGCINQNGTQASFSNRELAFASVGSSITSDADQLDFYNIIQNFQTTLSRQV